MDKKQPLWTAGQEQNIKEACDSALEIIANYGAMSLVTLKKLMDKADFNFKVTNSQGDSTTLSALAIWRTLRDKKLKAVNAKPYIIKEGGEVSEENFQAKRVFDALWSLGGIATLQNITYVLNSEGFSSESIKKALDELIKTNKVKHPFLFSPKRRVWNIIKPL